MLAFHGTPCGGPRQDVARFLQGRHALIPFHRPEDLGVAMEVCQTFCLDNSAFSIWRQGGTLDVPGYCSWVQSVRQHPAFAWALIPDVVDGSEEENNRLVGEWPLGHAGVPVWHLHESLDRLTFLRGEWPMVALGSSGKWPNPGTADWWERMGDVMRTVCDEQGRPMCKLHGLRMLSVDIFTRLPLASADSTNAVRNANLTGRFGMYAPPNHAQRMSVIADRIEAHQSAAVWNAQAAEPTFFSLEADHA